MGVNNDGAVAGRSLVMFILETEGSIEKRTYGKSNGV